MYFYPRQCLLFLGLFTSTATKYTNLKFVKKNAIDWTRRINLWRKDPANLLKMINPSKLYF